MVKIYSTTYINSVFAIRRGLASSFPPRFFSTRNGIPSCFLFRGMVRNRIPRVCFYFCSTERNSELFSLPRKGSEGNSESILLFLFYGTEFRVVFSSAEGFGTEFRRFLFRGTAGIPSEISLCSVFSVFRGIIFLSEIPNPNHSIPLSLPVHCVQCTVLANQIS
jgi:hypothetical protein